MIWLSLAALTLVVLLLLLVPLLRRQTAAAERLGYDVAIYRDQLAEVERDRERGLLSTEQAAAVTAEVQRRMLAAADSDGLADPVITDKKLETGRRLRLIAAMLVLVLVPGGAVTLYLQFGAPGLPAQPFAERQNSPQFKLTAMAEKLATELVRNPDPRGFTILAGTYRQLGRMDEAIGAYRKAIDLGAASAEIYASLGEVITMAAQGGVGPESRAAFLQALTLDPKNPPARFYLGLSKAQIGKADEAIAIWRDLQKDTPADAPWRSMLDQQIVSTAAEAKLDPAKIEPKAPSLDGAPAAPVAPPASKLGGQDAMIRQMVAGLAAKLEKAPNDADGWVRLSRSYRVLGDLDKAKDAARKAIALKPKEVDPLLTLADAQLGAATGNLLPPDFLSTMGQVLALDPNNGDALYYLGAAEAQSGHAAKAREMWTKVLDQMPADSLDRADLVKQIEGLGK